MTNRTSANPIYFDVFNADATLAAEGNPFIVVRGYDFDVEGFPTAKSLNRPSNERLFD